MDLLISLEPLLILIHMERCSIIYQKCILVYIHSQSCCMKIHASLHVGNWYRKVKFLFKKNNCTFLCFFPFYLCFQHINYCELLLVLEGIPIELALLPLDFQFISTHPLSMFEQNQICLNFKNFINQSLNIWIS